MTVRAASAAVDALLARARRDVDEGRLPSCQVAVALRGELQAFEAFGDADTSSRYLMLSVTKALTAGVVWLLLGDGSLRPDTRVADVVPEFGTNGKDVVTVEHLMTHTSGFARAPMRPLEGADHAARLARFASWRLDWEPGTRTEYHPSSSAWVLAEVVERITGRSLGRVLAERITEPLGLPRLQLGVPEGEQGDILDVVTVGEIEPSTVAALERVGATATLQETGREQLLRFNEPTVRAAGAPGAGAVGTAADVARYFHDLVANPGEVWDPAVLADATGTIRNGFVDPWTMVATNRTLGLRVAGDDGNAPLRGFGLGVGPRTFGATGVGGQVAWADPDSGIEFCYLTNGLDVDPVRSWQRQSALSEAAAACAPAPAG